MQWVERTYGDAVPPPPEKKRVLGLFNGDNMFETRGVFMSKPPTTDRRDYICWSHATLKHFIVYDGRLRIQHENIQFKASAAAEGTGGGGGGEMLPHSTQNTPQHNSSDEIILKTFSNTSSQSQVRDQGGSYGSRPEVQSSQQLNSKSSTSATNGVPSFSYL